MVPPFGPRAFFPSLFRYYSCLYCFCLEHLHILLTAGLGTVCLRLQLSLFVVRNKPIYMVTFVGVHVLFSTFSFLLHLLLLFLKPQYFYKSLVGKCVTVCV